MTDWLASAGSPELWSGAALSLCIGVALSAACGFRVFIPMLCLSVAAKLGWVGFDEGFAWIGSWPALIAFALATALETGAFYVPWLDNALDTVKAPAAMLAGTIATAGFLTQVDPLLQWSCAIIAGAGAAGLTSLGMAGVRVISTAATGGFGNFLVATFEWVAAFFLSVLAVILPPLAALLTLVTVVFLGRFAWRFLFRRKRLAREALPPPEKLTIPSA
jgi:hypothetical protein